MTALERAAVLYHACGAQARRERVLAGLRTLGSQGRRAADAVAGPGSLSQREREVAVLAAAGLPTKDIGQRLFISERTVETHLGRVYAKLGIRSKVDLVRRAAELDLRPT